MVARVSHLVTDWRSDRIQCVEPNRENERIGPSTAELVATSSRESDSTGDAQHARADDSAHESDRLLELFFSQSLDGFFFMMLDEPVRWDDDADKDALIEYPSRTSALPR